jgi:hypothetical protein
MSSYSLSIGSHKIPRPAYVSSSPPCRGEVLEVLTTLAMRRFSGSSDLVVLVTGGYGKPCHSADLVLPILRAASEQYRRSRCRSSADTLGAVGNKGGESPTALTEVAHVRVGSRCDEAGHEQPCMTGDHGIVSGRFAEAADLARAARTGTAGIATAPLNAHLHTMEARALARLGDAKECDRALAEAVREFERRRPDDDQDWIPYSDVNTPAGRAAGDNGPPEVRWPARRAAGPRRAPRRQPRLILSMPARAVIPAHRNPRAPQHVPAADWGSYSAWNLRPGSALAAQYSACCKARTGSAGTSRPVPDAAGRADIGHVSFLR